MSMLQHIAHHLAYMATEDGCSVDWEPVRERAAVHAGLAYMQTSA